MDSREAIEWLQKPFKFEDIEWRAQQAGISNNGNPYCMVLAYVTNRAIMNRLDEVFGPFGWQNQFRDLPGGGVECGISVLHDGQWITKWDAASQTQIEATKGGRSDSMKRAAVQWGIGRYLYKLDATFANCGLGFPPQEVKSVATKAKFKSKSGDQWGYWLPPQLPEWALPKEGK